MNLPLQTKGSLVTDSNPDSHAQLNPPGLFSHLAFSPQVLFDPVHSSMSENHVKS